MTDLALMFGHDSEGRPVAAAEQQGEDRNTALALATFLTEEVRWPHYAALLLDHAMASKPGEAGETATGNAYAVAFGNGDAVIEHLHLADRPPIQLPLAVFIEVLSRWFEHLAETDRAACR